MVSKATEQLIEEKQKADLKKELEEKLLKMAEDKEKKLSSAKEQLVENLKITADKYRTATGTAEALRVLRFVTEGLNMENCNLIYEANILARDMANICNNMSEVANDLEYENMDQLCKEFYDADFKVDRGDKFSWLDLASAMLSIDLCRNVGPAAEDIVGFIARTDEEIEATKKALEELEA